MENPKTEIHLSARELAEFLLRGGSIDNRLGSFDRAQEGARVHRRLQAEAKKQEGSDYQSELTLSGVRELGNIRFTIDGRADGVFTGEEGRRTVEEIKSTAGPIPEEGLPEHWAQAEIYGALLCEAEGLSEVEIMLTYFSLETEEIRRYRQVSSSEQLEKRFLGLLSDYLPWAEGRKDWQTRRDAALREIHFPFPRYRPGQREMAGEAYRAFRDGRVLLCQAPTGIGKSLSAVFPALKAMGAGLAERIFYLTARGTAAASAENAVRLLREGGGLSLRVLTLTAKDKLCFLEKRDCNPEACPYADGYYNRLRAGIREALKESDFTREKIERLARELTLCPFEFQLDLSLWCDLLIGDYNYLFDPVVSLKRYFDRKGDFLFLVDEAHNLPDRARDMYSASLRLTDLEAASRLLGRKRTRLKKAFSEAIAAFKRLHDLCMEEENHTFFQDMPPGTLMEKLSLLTLPMRDFLDQHKEGEVHDELLELYFQLQDLLRTADGYDDHYRTQCSAWGSEAELALLCFDPSDFIAGSLELGRGSLLFSATLSPPAYYKDLFGCPEARCVALPSPFPRENLGLYFVRISTRYRDREGSAEEVARYLYRMVSGRPGNYMAYFPSYAYLEMVMEKFSDRYPEVETLSQAPGMDEKEREAFLGRFSAESKGTLLGFGVMGGVFGEGIDLTGEKLIGTAVIGVGLPMVSPRQEELKSYCGERFGDGFDYAYRFPGMNKVLQAAGRVIRTDSDRGVVVVLDDRYFTSAYRSLCPPHWNGGIAVRSPEELEKLEKAFWKGEGR